jgi:hypothetical protein
MRETLDHSLSLSDPDRSLVLSFTTKFSQKFSIVSNKLYAMLIKIAKLNWEMYCGLHFQFRREIPCISIMNPGTKNVTT